MADLSKVKIEGTSYDIKDASARTGLAGKQDTLVSGTNIKTVAGQSLLGSGNIDVAPMVETTWAALKALRDGGNLVPGQQYRITDYQCMTAQADTSSANHQFDIIVTADSAAKLNEEACACLHANDTYFANNKLEAWQLWYCLDNDTTRFAWAQVPTDAHLIYYSTPYLRDPQYDGVNGNYCWREEGTAPYYIFTDTLDAPTTGSYWMLRSGTWRQYGEVDVQYVPATSIEGKGVIYRMIDEFDNDCPYDFKNILFTKSEKYTNAYTFTYTQSSTLMDASLLGASKSCHSNVVGAYLVSGVHKLNFTVFYSTSTSFSCYTNKIGIKNHDNTIGNSCYNNFIGTGFYDNSIGYEFYSNTIGNKYNGNTISQSFYFNTIGNDFYGNTIGHDFYYNTVGHHCYSNAISNECCGNIINNYFQSNTIGIYFHYNTVGNSVSSNSIGSYFRYNTIGNTVSSNTVGKYFRDNTIGNNFSNNLIGPSTSENVYVRHCRFDEGVQYISLTSDDTSASSSNYLQNVHVHAGLQGSSSERKTVTIPDRNLSYTVDVYPIGSTEIFA